MNLASRFNRNDLARYLEGEMDDDAEVAALEQVLNTDPEMYAAFLVLADELAEATEKPVDAGPTPVDRHVEALDGFRLSQQPSVTVRDARVKEKVRPRNPYFLGIVAIATMTMATALLLMLSGTTMPTTPPSAVAVNMQPADGVQRASENAVDPETEYVVGPKTPSNSYWAVFLCDDRGLKLIREGKPGEKLDPRWKPFRTPRRNSSQFAYTISIATHWKCSNLLKCLQAGLTAEDLKRLQQLEFARSDEDCKETTAFFSKIANTCTCTKGLSTVLAERWIISDPVPQLPSTKE